jgi:two-component system response regulator FixJ
MSSDRIVHVVDDDAAVLQSVSFLLASDAFPVRVYDSAVSFFERIGEVTGGCIVTDVRMPEIDGLEFMKRLKSRGIMLPVIVMTGHADVALAVEAMKEGAVEFLEKPFDDTNFLSAVRAALQVHATRAEREAQTREVRNRLESLSERERQVLDGVVAGSPNKVIAHDLGISPRTVEIYRANVMAKLQAHSLSELVRLSLLGGAH